MSMGIERSMVERLAHMTEAKRWEFIAAMLPEDALRLDADFEAWHADGQAPPSADGWRVWLMMAGRGYGKTRAGAEWIHRLAMSGRRRIALVGASIDEARAVMVEGKSGLLTAAARRCRGLRWEPSLGRLKWPNGSVATLFSGENPDGLRGPEHDFAWCDELAKWAKPEAAWDNLQMGLRHGPRPRALVTTTPRPMRLLDRIRAEPWTVETGGRTGDNLSLPKAFIEVMIATYGGSRLGRQELNGELMTEAEGSLFPRAMVEAARVPPLTLPPLCGGSLPLPQGERGTFDRIVVGVDPAVGTEGDACGIVVAGRREGKLYVLADASVSAGRPERWARAVAVASAEWGASHVVAEANQGGALVESVLTAADSRLKVKLVHATRGKVARAEPVAIRFETGRAFFAGVFPELEAELAGLMIGGGYDGKRSPDRADAMVWAMTELSETRSGVPRVRML
ncbi:terminase family protein [Sphingomonas sp.]|uniref:DNA-packaging protein n=1 Tax=Sphingomonas sp. TaxID=28214 RepID=UPI0025F89D19|nr:terminase family protein [Sphingomonas sp.]